MRLIGPSPVLSILDQTPWPCGFYSFRNSSYANGYFNPALVEWRERDYLIVRRRTGTPSTAFHNTLEAWLLKHNRPVKCHPIRVVGSAANESHDDPRAIVRGGKTIIVSCCNHVHPHGFAHQCMFGLRNDFSTEIPVRIKFGFNGEQRTLNTGHEKNWAIFEHEGRIHISYALQDGGHSRHIVVKTQNGKATAVTYGRAPLWSHGVLRGGTPPVLVNGLYWTFFHSSTYWYCNKRRYHMGALAFEPQPPFHAVRMTALPLLSASDRDPRWQHADLVVFPGGAIYRDGKWLVALGVNDHDCAWIQIPHEALLKRCYVC